MKFESENTSRKFTQKSDLGGSWASFGRGLGEVLEPLGDSGQFFLALCFMLVFGVVFKSALGGLWAGSWVDFEGFGKDFGRVLHGFWEEIWRNLADSWLFWAF